MSGTPLSRKLGVTDGSSWRLIGAPASVFATLSEEMPLAAFAEDGADGAVIFLHEEADLVAFVGLITELAPPKGVWVAWPKKASGVPTPFTFEIVQAAGLATGWVDNKVCAIDETWTGLRFVRRRA